MGETSKTNIIRGDAFLKRYIHGKVIDIGAGNDLVCDFAEQFDIEDGDANFISRYREVNSYDCVHSSHCLEHMHNPESALQEWWSLVKPGGYLVLVVPDEDLYEQGVWPSIFNSDHKVTFTLKKQPSWSPVSHNIEELVKKLPQVEIVRVELQDFGYDYSLHRTGELALACGAKNGRTLRRFLMKLIRSIVKRLPFVGNSLRRIVENLGFLMRIPVDQTPRGALAQIQVIARKKPVKK